MIFSNEFMLILSPAIHSVDVEEKTHFLVRLLFLSQKILMPIAERRRFVCSATSSVLIIQKVLLTVTSSFISCY